ncbi:hypothetical protein [Tissierella sp.]|uniref:hypothetical protein n=1 Tax=Tissierella sp. TaxID=41274 RepID=UPI002864E47C|nr:hypothetical protein [Tissierella sp.]MDR7856056.1 hypothetical protein [Tissierella sp.]
MDELELYKELYYHELQIRENIDSRFTNPFSVYVILIGGMGYLIGQVSSLPDETKTGIVIMMLLAYGVSLVFTGYWLYRAYHRHTYAYVENPLLLRKLRLELEGYYEDNFEKYFSEQSSTKEELIKKDFDKNLLEKFAVVSTKNQDANHLKYRLFLKVGNSLVLNAILWALNFILITIL